MGAKTSEYFLSAHVIPILAVGLATVGLNILTGLTGQLIIRNSWVYVCWCIWNI